MAKIIYTAITSLDGSSKARRPGSTGRFPTPRVHEFVNDLERPVGRTFMADACRADGSSGTSTTLVLAE